MDDLLAGLLRGEALDHRALKASGALAIHDAALVHDILPLVADRLAFAPELPVDLRESFMEDAHRAAAVDLAADLELRRLLEAFAAGGVRLLLIKGSHLAYTHFDRPDLRARIDSDVLISLDDRGVADAIITTELGYTAPAKPSGDFTATQKLYVKTENAADVHIVDLHWRLTSPQAFAHVLSFEELYASSVAVPALGRWARGPSNVHALVIACMHRVAHHHDEADQFKWLYDIHLLASGLAEEEWDAFARFLLEREVAAVCLESLERSARWFHTVVPARITADDRFAAARVHEATAAFLRVRPKAREVLDDVRALRSWRDRAALVGEHLFPAADYMTRVYAPGAACRCRCYTCGGSSAAPAGGSGTDRPGEPEGWRPTRSTTEGTENAEQVMRRTVVRVATDGRPRWRLTARPIRCV